MSDSESPSPPVAVVSTPASMARLVANVDGALWLKDPMSLPPESLAQVRIGDFIYLIGADDRPASRHIFLRLEPDGFLLGPASADREYAPVVERLVQFAVRTRSVDVR